MFPPKSPQADPLETPLELSDPNCPGSRKLQTTFPSHNTPHGAGTHSIEGKKWQEKARHFAGDFWKRLALMVTKWDSYHMVHIRNSKRYWLRFGSRAGCQNFRAFFRATLKTSRRLSNELCHVERGQCCPPIYLTSAKQHAKEKRILHATKCGIKDCPGFLNSTGRLGPKRGRKCYVAPAFSGVPKQRGTKSEVKTSARGHHDAPRGP